jgi:hypothetical protein
MRGCTKTAAVISFKCLEPGARIGVKWGKGKEDMGTGRQSYTPRNLVVNLGCVAAHRTSRTLTGHRQYFASRREACGPGNA